jgi:hypothetical protein
VLLPRSRTLGGIPERRRPPDRFVDVRLQRVPGTSTRPKMTFDPVVPGRPAQTFKYVCQSRGRFPPPVRGGLGATGSPGQLGLVTQRFGDRVRGRIPDVAQGWAIRGPARPVQAGQGPCSRPGAAGFDGEVCAAVGGHGTGLRIVSGSRRRPDFIADTDDRSRLVLVGTYRPPLGSTGSHWPRSAHFWTASPGCSQNQPWTRAANRTLPVGDRPSNRDRPDQG